MAAEARDGFRPAWWLPGAHAQTLGARLLRSRRGVRLRRQRLELSDGDFLDLDWAVRDGGDETPLVLVLHGLEGCAESGYTFEMYRALHRVGLDAVGLNFRSCSGEPNRLARMYHSGETDDLRLVLRELSRRYPARPLGAVGFSLGGNVLLKHLGEQGQRGTQGRERLRSAAAISVPFDLAAGAERINRGFSVVYQTYLVRRLRRKVRAKTTVLTPHIDVPRVLRARTFREFDDLGTAPLHGFADADDYYTQSSSRRFLGHIRIPTLLIHSRDDPFLPAEAVPERLVRQNPHLDARFTTTGGHVGFVTGPPWAPGFWAERTAATFLARQLGGDAVTQRPVRR